MSKSLDPTNPVYPANRAMASLKLNKWQDAEDDATRALRHDSSYQKEMSFFYNHSCFIVQGCVGNPDDENCRKPVQITLLVRIIRTLWIFFKI